MFNINFTCKEPQKYFCESFRLLSSPEFEFRCCSFLYQQKKHFEINCNICITQRTDMASKGKAAPKRAPKKKNGYEMPKPLKPADILTDNQKNQWKVGVSIGVGGFGEIYSACKASAAVKKVEDYPYVVKIVSCI